MILVAENLTITDPAVAAAIAGRDPGPLAALADLAGRAGARYLDVNLGRGRHGAPEALDFVLGALEGRWKGGLLIDSTSPELMDYAAERARGWPGGVVLNGYSADAGREGVLDVAARHGLPLVVFLMAGGIPKTVGDRLALAAHLVGRCEEKGIGLDRLWIDPVVAPLDWTEGQEYDVTLLEVLRRLPELFGVPVASLIGLSNLTTGAAGRRRAPWMQEVLLALAAGAGLTHVMLDVRNARLLRVARAIEVFEGRRLYAPEEFFQRGAEDPGMGA